MQPRNNRIFISYRRGTSAPWAGRLFDALCQAIPSDRVFLDVNSIPLGMDFNLSIDAFLSRCAVTLVLIDRNWLDARDHRGIRRLEFPDDPVRKEIASALRNCTWTIPVLLDGAAMPRPDQLPEDIAHLAHMNAISLSHDSFFRDFDYLRHALWEFLGDLISDPADGTIDLKLHRPKIIGSIVGPAVNTAPLPPDYYVPTQQASAEAKRQLLGALHSGNACSLLLLGQGGIGKSTLAQALCHDADISSSFSDGIFWVSVGPATRLDVAIELSCNAFLPRPQASSTQAFLSLFISHLRKRRALLVLDDVWDQYADPSFELLRTSINVLITTRLETVAQRLGVQPLRVEAMGQTEAIALLQRASISEAVLEPRPSSVLVDLLDRLPLAVTVVARLITDNSALRSLTTRLATEVNRVAMLEKTARGAGEDPSARYRSVYASISLSLQHLRPNAQKRFSELAVLKFDQGLSVGCAATVWGCDTVIAQQHIVELSYVSLVKRRYDMSRVAIYEMHHLVHNCAVHLLNADAPPSNSKAALIPQSWWRRRRSSAAAPYRDAQRRLVDRIRSTLDEGKWATLDQEPYFVRNLFWHFLEAQLYGEMFSALREEFIDARSRSVVPARLKALERVSAAHQYSTDIEVAWDAAKAQLDKHRTPNALADAVLCKALRVYVSSTQFGGSGESIWLMLQLGLWTDAEAASWAKGLPNPLEIAAITASISSDRAIELLRYCARRLWEKGIPPNDSSGRTDPSWQWLLEVAIFHGMDCTAIMGDTKSTAVATDTNSEGMSYDNMAVVLELLPPYVIPSFCKVILSNFVTSREKERGDWPFRLGLALELASMICGDGLLTIEIRRELFNAVRSQHPSRQDQLDILQDMVRVGMYTVLDEICLLDENAGYQLALDLTDERDRNPWPAAFVSRRPTEGFASASDAFFLGSQYPRLDYKVDILLRSFSHDPAKGIELCLRAIEALSVALDIKNMTIPRRAAFSLVMASARGGCPTYAFLSQYKSPRHQSFVRFLTLVASASAVGLSDPVGQSLREELKTAPTSEWVFAFVALAKVHGKDIMQALEFREFAARRNQVSLLQALHSCWDAAPAWLRSYWSSWSSEVAAVGDHARFLQAILLLRASDLNDVLPGSESLHTRECCRVLNNTTSRSDRMKYLYLAAACRSLGSTDKKSIAASAGRIEMPNVDEDAIAGAFAKSVALMKGSARERLLVQAPILHRFRAVRLSTDDRKKCAHWQARLSGTDLLILPTGAEPLEDPANPALAEICKPLPPNWCLVEDDKWFGLSKADCLNRFVDWLLKFDAYADWKVFFETSSGVSRALIARSESTFQKALLQETLRLMRWLL